MPGPLSRRDALRLLGALGVSGCLDGAAQPVPTVPITPATVAVNTNAIGLFKVGSIAAKPVSIGIQ